MDVNKNIQFNTKGHSNTSKLLPQLDPDFIKVDERSIADFIAFISKFSSHIKFIDDSRSKEKNWSQLFESNIAFLISEIACIDLKSIDKRYQEIVSNFDHLHSENEQEEKTIHAGAHDIGR